MAEASLNLDYLLQRFVRRIAENYSDFDRAFVSGRIFFAVAVGGAVLPRTVLLEADAPRLYEGIVDVESESVPYVNIKLTVQQLAALLKGTLDPDDPDSANVEFAANSVAFYNAVGRCL